jgi:hypothetical protein
MAKVYTHTGSYESIPVDASPGLRFLKCLLPILDSLEPTSSLLTTLTTPKACFITNGESAGVDDVLPKLSARSEKLSAFRHDVSRVWDIENSEQRRTVMYESVSVSVFKMDKEQKEIRVPEFNVIELETTDESSGLWQATELKVYKDAEPNLTRLSEIN